MLKIFNFLSMVIILSACSGCGSGSAVSGGVGGTTPSVSQNASAAVNAVMHSTNLMNKQ